MNAQKAIERSLRAQHRKAGVSFFEKVALAALAIWLRIRLEYEIRKDSKMGDRSAEVYVSNEFRSPHMYGAIHTFLTMPLRDKGFEINVIDASFSRGRVEIKANW